MKQAAGGSKSTYVEPLRSPSKMMVMKRTLTSLGRCQVTSGGGAMVDATGDSLCKFFMGLMDYIPNPRKVPP